MLVADNACDTDRAPMIEGPTKSESVAGSTSTWSRPVISEEYEAQLSALSTRVRSDPGHPLDRCILKYCNHEYFNHRMFAGCMILFSISLLLWGGVNGINVHSSNMTRA